jgi:hypothetical protein
MTATTKTEPSSQQPAKPSPLSGRSLRVVRIILCLAAVPLELAALRYGLPPKEGLPMRCHLWLPLPMSVSALGHSLDEELYLALFFGTALLQFPAIVGVVCLQLGRHSWRKVVWWTFATYAACVLTSISLFALLSRVAKSQ